jgi:hypothetical protein
LFCIRSWHAQKHLYLLCASYCSDRKPRWTLYFRSDVCSRFRALTPLHEFMTFSKYWSSTLKQATTVCLHLSVISSYHLTLLIFKAVENSLNNGRISQAPSYGLLEYRVFTKEWCGFKNVLNDYILQLDGDPPIFRGMYESYSIVFSNSAGSDVLQMETTTYTYYMGRIRLSCGCVSCDPGCTH